MTYPYVKRIAGITTSTSNAYSAGDAIGGIQQVTNISAAGFIQGVSITCKSSQTGQVDVCFYRSSMPNSSIADNVALNISTQDSTSMLPVIHVSDWTSEGTCYLGTANGLAYDYMVPDLNSLYYTLIARGTPTLGSTNDVQVTLTFVS